MTCDREYLRAAEIAALTGMSLRSVRRWLADEILPSTKLGGARLVAAIALKAALSEPLEDIQDAPGDNEESYEESDG
jgi:excisionase family DNA binding protein